MLSRCFALLVCILTFSVKAWCEDLSSATDPLSPGTFTTWEHSDEWKIRNASAAGPSFIAERATIIDWADPKVTGRLVMGRTLREGSNGWTCMPDMPGRPQHAPMCADESMMKFLMSVIAGKQPKIDKVGLSYMLLGEAREGQNIPPTKDPSQVKQWFYTGPHINPAQAVRLARGPIFVSICTRARNSGISGPRRIYDAEVFLRLRA